MIAGRKRTVGLLLLVLFLLVSTSVLAAPYGSRTLSPGAFGGDVIELQRRLNSLGYNAGTPDGMFGARTKSALVAFQRDYGLIADGLAGKWTFRTVDRAYTWQHGFTHQVARGESLWSISVRYGTKVEALVWLNSLKDEMVYPGMAIRVPGTARKPAPSAPVTTPKPAPVPVQAPKPTATAAPSPQPPPAPAPAPTPKPVPQPTGTPTNPSSGGGSPATQTQNPSVQAGQPDSAPAPQPAPATPAPGLPANQTPVQTPPTGRQYTVLGYYAEDWPGDMRSLNSFRNSMEQVDLVVNFQLLIDEQGQISTGEYPHLMSEAGTRSIKVQGLLHNMRSGSFDPAVARAVLGDPAIRSRAVENLTRVAREKGLSGINVDIENVPPELRHQYTAFVKELSGRLKPLGLGLTLSIPAKTWDDTRSSWSGAFDYRALGAIADQIVPMAYDENLPGFPAGPVASLAWVERVAAFAASQMEPRKVLLGIAAYGYDWRRGGTEGRGISVAQAMSLALKHSATVQWDEKAMVPYFNYVANGQERVVYFENARSLEPKLEIVRKHGLGGIGIWRLGLEDAAIWPVIREKLR